ncbi:LamG domain-containing protein (plasmid) [Haloferax mediterranei ATCC 33500]|uniref:LamG domain-containing protein n=1 Tax=Haloferax mediterranei (strain ATCC 33500 / DSM 1411 / JCM 8866 / NBRC 14739 / NCIMB 2177 / R-4) TaxID=523841 RepID=I3RAF3_HALMT|nr:LamG domain-containing protein [Haloferax mediterranei]AFK21213.1 hypothetical protein HFX_6088 [Haloferax mediterranei ATCC 33500]AHZ24677.1 hypothetical protein BM92_17490 [Haloferax mediterranei ATCC 33500]ELZ97453.1 hypothetical protein C439_19063 [Haloferax mediterranei ATCC 33500]MDX5990256.1 LamG domain-containing protein [Haloferax mediterranei ATCC 33500]QCQ76677.1 LamG domain-containing protein [Haloferax mediterranei ATCC 33500]
MTGKWTRRSALAFLATGAGMLAVDSAGFTTVDADRTSTLGTTDDSSALLGVDGTRIEGSDGDSVTLTTLTNRFDEPLTWFRVDVPIDAPILDVETPRQLNPGEQGDIEATLSCPREEATTIDLTITAGGNDQQVELTREFTVVCEDPKVAWWKFDEKPSRTTLADEWSNHSATRSRRSWPSSRLIDPWAKDWALYFGHGCDVLTIQDDTALDLTSEFTLSVWVKYQPGVHTSTLSRLFSKWNSVGDDSYQFFIAEKPFSDQHHEIVIETTEKNVLTGVSVTPCEWQLLTWTHSAERDRVYVDTELHDVPGVPNAEPSNQPLRIGNGVDPSGKLDYGFTGWLDDARIYDRELTPEQVRDLYDEDDVDW